MPELFGTIYAVLVIVSVMLMVWDCKGTKVKFTGYLLFALLSVIAAPVFILIIGYKFILHIST